MRLAPPGGPGKMFRGSCEGSWELSVKTFAAIIYFGNGINLRLKNKVAKECMAKGRVCGTASGCCCN